MSINDKKIKEALLGEAYVEEQDIKAAEGFAKKNGTSFLDYLFSKNLITKDLVGQAIAEHFQRNYADLNSIIPDAKQVKKIPERIARKHRVVLFQEKEDEVIITTDNITEKKSVLPNEVIINDSDTQDDIFTSLREVFPDKKITIAYSLTEDIDAVFRHYQKPLETRFSKIIKSKKRVVPELLEEIFDDALSYKASDIHFEPRDNHVLVRFRIDGSLQEAGRIPKEFYENILNRIKVESSLRIDEHFTSQDGALRYEKENNTVDFRTSIIPTVQGEKVVLRILSAYAQSFSLGDLGFSFEQEEMLAEAAQKPFGMILVSGPTGSGKTTTLYGLLKIVNAPDVNIATIEDPVEYKVTGINQTQASDKSNLTFSRGLRSIIRQDPDIILVGEIRDRETAEIAVNAALTGHLLYSTFHANNAATSIPRLLDMGIEPFLLASTLEVVVSQRLVRKICEECRYSVTKKAEDFDTPKLKEAKKYFTDSMTFYEGKGCSVCNYTGYKGRTGIFEFIKVTEAIQELILEKPSTNEINKVAKKEGAKSMFEDGVRKIKSGITTLEEVMRVTDF